MNALTDAGANTSPGVVTRLDGEFAWVEVARRGSCGSCESREGCGSGLLGVAAPARQYRLFNDIGARPGDAVTIALAEGGVIRAAALAYLLPAVLGIVGAASGMALGGDGHAAIGLALGLAAGLLLLRVSAQRKEPELRMTLQPQVIRLQPRFYEEP